MIRVVIADDHPLIRLAVRRSLEVERDVQVVGEAVNGKEAVERVGDERPDVVILDHRMPVLDGLQAAREIGESFPEVGMILLTGEEDRRIEAEATRAGIRGFLLKTQPVERLVRAIRRVARR